MRHPRSALATGGEFDLIARFLEGSAAGDDVLVGPGDDCAVLAPDLAVSTDLFVEDVHFRRAWLEPEEIGWRAAAGALSDLAAVAAEPVALLASAAFPQADVPAYAERVMSGLRAAAGDAGAPLIGGDVSASPGPLALDVVVIGRTAAPVLRSGAAAGDELWVTGRLGGAAAAVAAWRSGRAPGPEAREAFARPRPRLREARWLLARGVLNAMIDLSDGLAGDAAHIAAASGVGIVIEAERVPLHAGAGAAASPEEALNLALAGGEDYELCFAAPAGGPDDVARQFETEFGLPLTRVGRVVETGGVQLERGGRRQPLRPGFRHFERGTA